MQTDVLIIGSGIAGLAFAIKLAERKPKASICVVTKANRFESNTKYAQGGIAAVMDNVNNGFDAHIKDTLKAGKGFSNVETVTLVVKKAPQRLEELIRWGTPFDKTEDGSWDYGLEGGHSVARILHHKDQTGLALEKALLNQLKLFESISFLTELFATDLLVKNNRCHGATFLDKTQNKRINIHAKITYLATGGSGQVFSRTTNPLIATGDGAAMAARAGARMEHMAFYQFHPTALAVNHSNPVFLISEAVRGFGAHLINHKGRRFIFDKHPEGELATRDVVSEAIFNEFERSGEKLVWLDCRHLDKKLFKKHFPNIVVQCRKAGIDVFSNPIPVAPAAHYQCGGIKVNHKALTSIKYLYANGECASTGLHGANRLASNSLLEAVVFAHEAAMDVAQQLEGITHENLDLKKNTPQPFAGQKPDSKSLQILKAKLQQLMYQFYLKKNLDGEVLPVSKQVEQLCEQIKHQYYNCNLNRDLLELKNISSVAQLIIKDTLYE